MYNKLAQNEKRSLKGIALILIGATLIAYHSFPLFYMLGLPFNLGTLRLIEFWVLGIAFILTGTFTLVQWKTRTGKIVLGLTSTIIGGILVLSTSIIIVEIIVSFWGTSSIFVFWNDIPVLATFLISGTVLLLNGLNLIITKQINMKVVWTVIFVSIGITIIIWVSRPLYFFLISPTLAPFFATALYLDLIIVGIVSLIICYFIIKPIKKERTKLLMGMISIIVGGIIIIMSLLGILNFYLYAGGMN